MDSVFDFLFSYNSSFNYQAISTVFAINEHCLGLELYSLNITKDINLFTNQKDFTLKSPSPLNIVMSLNYI